MVLPDRTPDAEASNGLLGVRFPGRLILTPTKAPEADWLVLFPDEPWNDFPPAERKEFRGRLKHDPDDNLPSYVQRYNPYKLVLEDGLTLDVYCGSSNALRRYVGKDVVIEGKRFDMEVEGHLFREIWPTRIRPAD